MDLFNKAVAGSMTMIPRKIVGRIASRYIAGENLSDAIDEVKKLNSETTLATIDLLGEFTDNKDDVRWVVNVYKEILEKINHTSCNSNISIKPTALGLNLGYDFCKSMIAEILAHATDYNNFVRIDMEDHDATDNTLKMYYELSQDFDNVGVVIQAYLRRTIKDVQWLKKMKANIRLCKGIYNEPRKIAYKNRDIIIRNFRLVLKELLEAGCYVGIATHCEETVWYAMELLNEMKLDISQYEFQMLLGVDPELRSILLDDGHKLRVYVPFGEEWYPYSSRRLKENPDLAGNIAKEFLRITKPGH